MNVWKWDGYTLVIYLAAITSIEGEYFEAARVDGASRFQQIRHITLPLLVPTTLLLVLLDVGRMFYGDLAMIYGLVGFYILVANWLGLKDNCWALILPYLLNPFCVFVLLAYFRTIPHELIEAAVIDGANDLVIFWRVICPISGAAIATVGLFYGLQYWNDWWLALLFIDQPNNHPLQYMLRALQSQVDASRYIGNVSTAYKVMVPTHDYRGATGSTHDPEDGDGKQAHDLTAVLGACGRRGGSGCGRQPSLHARQ